MEEKFIYNPFIVGKYLSDKDFCDRKEETGFLRSLSRSIILILPVLFSQPSNCC